MKAHNILAIKARNTLKPRSGFACVNIAVLREVASRGFAVRNVSHKCLRGPFWEFPTKLKSII